MFARSGRRVDVDEPLPTKTTKAGRPGIRPRVLIDGRRFAMLVSSAPIGAARPLPSGPDACALMIGSSSQFLHGAHRALHAERSVVALGAMEPCDHEPGNSSPSLPRPSGIRSRRRRTPAPLLSTFNLRPSTPPITFWLTAYSLCLTAHGFWPASYG